MYKYLLGALVGVILANTWNAWPEVQAERAIPAREVIGMLPEQLQKFEHRQVYVIVRFDKEPKVAVIMPDQGRINTHRFLSNHPALMLLPPGTRFLFDQNKLQFFVLPRPMV